MNTIEPATKKLITQRPDNEAVALDKTDKIKPTGERGPRQQKQASTNKSDKEKTLAIDKLASENENLDVMTYDKKGKSSAKNRLNLSV